MPSTSPATWTRCCARHDLVRSRRHLRDGQHQQRRLRRLAHLRRHSELPIHGHRTDCGATGAHPLLGIGFTAYQKLCRLAGVDHLHVNGFNSKFYESNDEVGRSINDCLQHRCSADYRVMPAISSAQWAGSALPIYAASPHDRRDPPRRRRDHRASRRHRCRRAEHAAGLGGGALRRDPGGLRQVPSGAARRDREVRRPRLMATAPSFCSPSTATTSPARRMRWRRSRCRGLRTVLFLAPPTPDFLQRSFRICAHGRSRHQPCDATGRDGRAARRCFASCGALGAPITALQGVLDVRLGSGSGQHRPRGRHGARDARSRPDHLRAGWSPAAAALYRIRQPLRRGGRRGLPARSAPDHVAPSGDADA